MTNDLAAELKALLEKADIRDMIVKPFEDGEWCSITTPSIDVCGGNVVIYARRVDRRNDYPDIELSDFGVTDFNIDDKNIIKAECKIWHLIHGLGKCTDIHTAVAAQPKDFYYAFTHMYWAVASINNIVAFLEEEEEDFKRDE